MRCLSGLFVSAIFLVVTSGGVLADDLSADRIERFLDSMVDLKPWGEAHRDILRGTSISDSFSGANMSQGISDEKLEKMRRPFSLGVAAAREAGLGGELEDIVGDHGFDLDEWGETGDQTMRAYIAIQIEGKGVSRAKLEKMMAQMDANPRMTDAMKVQMRKSMEGVVRMYETMRDVPNADIEAVRPYQNRMAEVMR